jgi:hypothetical protein
MPGSAAGRRRYLQISVATSDREPSGAPLQGSPQFCHAPPRRTRGHLGDDTEVATSNRKPIRSEAGRRCSSKDRRQRLQPSGEARRLLEDRPESAASRGALGRLAIAGGSSPPCGAVIVAVSLWDPIRFAAWPTCVSASNASSAISKFKSSAAKFIA